jgi:hypothetical protein
MTTPPRATDRPETVLIPKRADMLVAELRTYLPERLHERVIDDSIQKILTSIAHKLTVAMYQAALICDVNSGHFTLFREIERQSLSSRRVSTVRYKGCAYKIRNIHEYRLFLTFFIETFSATIFSLLDVCGHLLNELYGFARTERNISFKKILDEELKPKYSGRSNPVYDLVRQYRVGDTTCRDWVQPLENIRNRTTHRPITDICRFETQGDLYDSKAPTEFFLNKDLFPSANSDVKLCDFVQRVFSEVDQFIDELYEHLRQGIAQSKGLPIY